ncbi:unnamed protein product [Thlaspi arvense]|uniref:GDSL esterase/lipase n=1 Tax=Thlaspi arvense TaxID=13288 RepID=A0AAU9RU50_THLAR|nr:unnamed protein product [Thlaspi arvense]
MQLPNSWICFSSSSTALIFSLLLVLFGVAQAVIRLPPNITFPAVFVFGDSIVDTGNNNNLKTIAKANHPPYGKDFMGGKPTGRFSNGRVTADFIAEELGIKELLPAYLDPSQLDLFKEYTAKLKGLVGGERTSTILNNSVFLVVAGSNDLANTYFTLRREQYDVPSYVDLIVRLASDFVKELYGLGARRIAVFGSPPGDAPQRGELCQEGHKGTVQKISTRQQNCSIHGYQRSSAPLTATSQMRGWSILMDTPYLSISFSILKNMDLRLRIEVLWHRAYRSGNSVVIIISVVAMIRSVKSAMWTLKNAVEGSWESGS